VQRPDLTATNREDDGGCRRANDFNGAPFGRQRRDVGWSRRLKLPGAEARSFTFGRLHDRVVVQIENSLLIA
jgi:hypothetical protein